MQRNMDSRRLIFKKPATAHSKVPLANSQKAKPQLVKDKQRKQKIEYNDENVNNCNLQQNNQKQRVTCRITKRIKKNSPKQRIYSGYDRIQPNSEDQIFQSLIEMEIKQEKQGKQDKIEISGHTFPCYTEQSLNFPQQFKSLVLTNHKQDNDCDSDWDTIEAGAMRLYRDFKFALIQEIKAQHCEEFF